MNEAKTFAGAQQRRVAVAIALQTHVLRYCPRHERLVLDDEADPAHAFALALELMRQRVPYVERFGGSAHALTDLLSETIAAAPDQCPECARDWVGSSAQAHGNLEGYHV